MGIVPIPPEASSVIDSLANGIGEGVGKKIVERCANLVCQIVTQRGPIIITKTWLDRCDEFFKEVRQRLSEVEDRVSALSSDHLAHKNDDPAFRSMFLEVIVGATEAPGRETREVLADLIVRQLLTDDEDDARQQREAASAVSKLSARRLRLVGAIGVLRYPGMLAQWTPFAKAVEVRDQGAFDKVFQIVLETLVPTEPTGADIERLLEVRLGERDARYVPWGMQSSSDPIDSFLMQSQFPMRAPDELYPFPALIRAKNLLRPSSGSMLSTEDSDRRGLEGISLFGVGWLVATSVVDCLLLRKTKLAMAQA